MKKRYFRRSRKDYPKGVLGIYDFGNKYFDRYTVVYEPYEISGVYYFPYVGMSERPFWPQGFGQHGELKFRYTRQKGEKCINFSELPGDCKILVLQDLSKEGKEHGKE